MMKCINCNRKSREDYKYCTICLCYICYMCLKMNTNCEYGPYCSLYCKKSRPRNTNNCIYCNICITFCYRHHCNIPIKNKYNNINIL